MPRLSNGLMDDIKRLAQLPNHYISKLFYWYPCLFLNHRFKISFNNHFTWVAFMMNVLLLPECKSVLVSNNPQPPNLVGVHRASSPNQTSSYYPYNKSLPGHLFHPYLEFFFTQRHFKFSTSHVHDVGYPLDFIQEAHLTPLHLP